MCIRDRLFPVVLQQGGQFRGYFLFQPARNELQLPVVLQHFPGNIQRKVPLNLSARWLGAMSDDQLRAWAKQHQLQSDTPIALYLSLIHIC